MRVAIVGGPGVGKSTLVRQLADLYHNGSYGEGEKGVWDPRVLEDIAAGVNAVGVTEYFARLYDANYRDAREHDGPGKVIFFEGARITLEAHMAEYPPEDHAALRKVLAIGDAWNPDRVIVLTSSTDTIEKHIRLRNREHEDVENMVRRFRLIERRRPPPSYVTVSTARYDSRTWASRCSAMVLGRLVAEDEGDQSRRRRRACGRGRSPAVAVTSEPMTATSPSIRPRTSPAWQTPAMVQDWRSATASSA